MAHPFFQPDRLAVPFRMQPGLRRLASGARVLTPLVAGSPLWQEKRRVVEAGASRLRVPGFVEADAVRAIFARAAVEGLVVTQPLELAFEEDFAVLDGADATLPWLCVCAPSHWAPEEKIGLPLAAVHAPVADAALLQAATKGLVQLVTAGDALWERVVWTLTPDPRHDQHPGRHVRSPWPEVADPDAFAASCWLRAERQCFFPFADGSPRAIFTIRVALQPLTQWVDDAATAARLAASLASMSDAVLAYKNLARARARLLAWLAARGA